MTEKAPELKTAPFDGVSDPTVVDTARVDPEEDQETPPSDPDPLAFNPDKFSRIEISYEMQQKMAQMKLPRLGPECFLDTVPPNKPLEAPAPPAEAERIPASGSSATAAEVIVKPRPPIGVVIVCLVGVVLLLGLAIMRSSNRDPEAKPVVPSPSKDEIAPTPVVSAAPEVIAPPPPASPAGPAELAMPVKAAPVQPERAAVSIHPKPPTVSKTARPAVASAPASPPSASLATAAPAPSPTPPAPSASPGPSWVNPR